MRVSYMYIKVFDDLLQLELLDYRNIFICVCSKGNMYFEGNL